MAASRYGIRKTGHPIEAGGREKVSPLHRLCRLDDESAVADLHCDGVAREALGVFENSLAAGPGIDRLFERHPSGRTCADDNEVRSLRQN